jgi:hypothetical protein
VVAIVVTTLVVLGVIWNVLMTDTPAQKAAIAAAEARDATRTRLGPPVKVCVDVYKPHSIETVTTCVNLYIGMNEDQVASQLGQERLYGSTITTANGTEKTVSFGVSGRQVTLIFDNNVLALIDQ